MEIKVNEIQALDPIKFNYDDIKQELIQKLENYKSMVYTDENIKLAKADRAMLNKLAKAINDEKIRINNELLRPGIDFNNKCGELTGMVKETSESIDKQIKSYEQKNKDAKLQEITKYFSENVQDLSDLIDFDKIYNEKWLNVTYKMSDIQTEIEHYFTKTKTDFNVIEKTFEDENISKQVKQYYLNNITDINVLTLAILEGNKVIENNKKLEDLKPKEQICTENKSEDTKNNELQTEELQQIDFRVRATKSKLMALKEFLKSNNIIYGPVPKHEEE